MNKKHYRKQTRKEEPRHIEARRLGANISALKKGSTDTAKDIKLIWDYRKAGLTVAQAREYIKKWNRKSYHINYDPYRHAIPGIYLDKQRYIKNWKTAYQETISRIENLPLYSETKLKWNQSEVRIITGWHTIITQRIEDVDWGKSGLSKAGRSWPVSSTVDYKSYLLPEQCPSTKEILARPSNINLESFADASMSHDLRGYWWERVITDLLGKKYVALLYLVS